MFIHFIVSLFFTILSIDFMSNFFTLCKILFQLLMHAQVLLIFLTKFFPRCMSLMLLLLDLLLLVFNDFVSLLCHFCLIC